MWRGKTTRKKNKKKPDRKKNNHTWSMTLNFFLHVLVRNKHYFWRFYVISFWCTFNLFNGNILEYFLFISFFLRFLRSVCVWTGWLIVTIQRGERGRRCYIRPSCERTHIQLNVALFLKKNQLYFLFVWY